MSLLTSLIRAGTQFQQAMEKRPPASAGRESGPTGAPGAESGQLSSPGDDRFTRSGDSQNDFQAKSKKLAIADYKATLGQDLAFVRETLRHKLAEYQLNPASRIDVSRDEMGGIRLEANLPGNISGRIEQDLNNSKPFREAFSRLSASEPTLHFMDNALKLNQAYGVNNSLLDTIVSENQQFNGLQDIVHRYDSLRRSIVSEDTQSPGTPRAYAFSLNTQA